MSKPLIARLNTLLNSGELLEIVDNSLSSLAVLKAIGYSEKGQYVGIVRQFLVDNEIEVSHFTPNGKPKQTILEKTCPVCNSIFHTEKRKTREQVTCSKGCSNSLYRSGINHPNYVSGKGSYRNIALSMYKNECANCGYNEDSDALEVHHRDHNRDNNEVGNLMVLCANCHSILHKVLPR